MRRQTTHKSCEERLKYVSPKFKLDSTSVADTPYYRSLEQLAKSTNGWMVWKEMLSHEGCCRALRTLTDRNQLLAASLRNSLTVGTLRFRPDTTDLSISKSKVNLCHYTYLNHNRLEYTGKGESQIEETTI